MGNYTILGGFENPRRGRQARNVTTNVSKILDLKSSARRDIFQKLSLCAPEVLIPVIFGSLDFQLGNPNR